MLCLTSWLRSFPAGILARYQDVIFCVSCGCFCLDLQGGLEVSSCPVPAEALGIHPELHQFLRLLDSAGHTTLSLHEPFGRGYSSFS